MQETEVKVSKLIEDSNVQLSILKIDTLPSLKSILKNPIDIKELLHAVG